MVQTPQNVGNLLVANFQSALISMQTSEAASAQARHREETVVTEMAALSGRSYLQPSAIEQAAQQRIGRASIDAHVMKVQAQQLEQLSYQQITEIQSNSTAQYVGKKVRIRTLDSAAETPFDVVWFNPQTGYRSNRYKKTMLRGTISEIILTKNLLILQPKRTSRFLNRELDAYFVYVIDPLTLEPVVTIEIE